VVLQLLLKLGAFDEADAMMKEGRKRYPGFEHFSKGYVQVAQQRGDPEEALRRCAVVRKKFPRLADGYTVAAECLTGLGRHDEAEAMIERAVRRVPSGLDLLVAYARQAERRLDWEEALRRWETVRAQFDHIYSHNGIAHCLRRIGRLDDAEKAAAETCKRFPEKPWAYATLADIAAARGDLDEAVRRWDTARRRCPSFAHAYKAGAAAERRAGRADKADSMLSLGVTMIRWDLDLHLQYAQSAHRRGDWAAAVERWALVRERFPDCDEARERAAEALAAAEQQGASLTERGAPVDVSEAPSTVPACTTCASAKDS
jgi:tetratricopeptide (TPR) repeat protein